MAEQEIKGTQVQIGEKGCFRNRLRKAPHGIAYS
jgi:hypothetical protein